MEKTERQDFIIGRNAVMELLKSGKEIEKIFVQNGDIKGSVLKILAMARENGVPIKEVSQTKLDMMCAGGNHQGVAASIPAASYAELEDIFALAQRKGEAPFLIIADEIEDPHNLGAIIRTAEAAGAHGIIIPKRRSVGLTGTVYKTSAGACAHLPVVRVSNITATMQQLKKQGVWLYGADMDGQNWCEQDYSGPVGLVIGSEGHGIGKLVRETCDFIVSLPMCGKVNSLNASVACGIMMYEITRQRHGIQAK
ncbi:23S rRNA (guanosine(2251)-2'-O)-methyltransferase RlmB [Candidatus Soleaferrea massiliensis]|uniref:23S rRNA (guanosine(2251)-2'-O)-methyltransferase RlmB n=1 Tax=Candidatus Soleaferrea massiliensis TaxID=1470354 RepID=UPI0005905870|nr:23S rRNA (guanosine(2251)-2'-O)-methyltransferase RlmB [Candidatus Soleaferrea massiliensis]